LLVAMVLFGTVSCGGSSSETPFPLEPDWTRLDAGAAPSESHPAPASKKSAEPDEEAPPPAAKR
jgi:hypothetical protein